MFCLIRDRVELVARIERRIDEQMEAGWLEEVRRLMAQGLEKNPTAMQAAGYRELVAHLRGEVSLPAAVALIKTRTRQLAKRQMTWFRREPGLRWMAVAADEPPEQTSQRIQKELFQRT
jgi:tRNA dimethylallyltransferase